MTSFSFTTEQIKSAPPEVGRWFENQIVVLRRELAERRPQAAHAPELAACTAGEAEAIFELIQNDFAATGDRRNVGGAVHRSLARSVPGAQPERRWRT